MLYIWLEAKVAELRFLSCATGVSSHLLLRATVLFCLFLFRLVSTSLEVAVLNSLAYSCDHLPMFGTCLLLEVRPQIVPMASDCEQQ